MLAAATHADICVCLASHAQCCLLMQVFVYKGAEALSRRFRCAIGFFYGRWYSPVPNKVQLTVLVGKAISVTKVDKPDTEQVLLPHAPALAFAFCCVSQQIRR